MSHLSHFHYAVLGSNSQKRIVFIHGLMAFSANWRKIANFLENDYQCLIYDQRGHGRSFKPDSGYSPEIMAEDLDKMTTELGWNEFHLVGHSMGGRNAMVFAHLFPQKVKTLTIEDMGPEADALILDYYKTMLENIPTPFKSKDEVKAFFENEFQKVFKSAEPNSVLSLFLQANIEEKSPGVFDWRFSKKAVYEIVEEGHAQDRWLEVSSFKMPVLLIRGETSHILSREVYEKMLAINPNIEGVEFKGTGHWIHYEKFKEFTECLRNFLNRHS